MTPGISPPARLLAGLWGTVVSLETLMSSRTRGRGVCTSRCAWLRPFRVLVAAALLPFLVVGPVLSGRTAILHTHDEEGAHAHLFSSHSHHPEATTSHSAVLAEHAALSEHHDAGSQPDAIVISFPEIGELGAPGGSSPLHSALDVPPPIAIFAKLVAPCARGIPTEGPAPPPPRAARSNITRLLLSSHALLI